MTSPSTLCGFALLGASTLARSLFVRPKKATLEERLAMLPTEDLPLDAPITIRWNDHQVPFVEAASDRDLAVGLGVVHGHLRLTQIELMRRIAEGRLSEFAGPAALELDRILRILELDRAADTMAEQLPQESRAWIEGFADGLNAEVAHLRRQGRRALPHEFRLLGIEPEDWRPRDLMAIARLAATDFTWKVWVRLLKLRRRGDWQQIWQRLLNTTLVPVPGFAGGGTSGVLDTLLGGFARHGSNSAAVSGARTTSGGAMIASDPHLGITLPNLWLMAGWRSPSYEAVGLMIPGVPVLALGRNRHIAWGGTSLHAASSDLFEVGRHPPERIEIEHQTIKVRWWPNRKIAVRNAPEGPIVSDSSLLAPAKGKETLALRWIGHQPSDEMSALLGVARARNWDDFLGALESFAVPAQNMIYADATGRVAQCMAARLPRRPLTPPEELVATEEAARHWETPVSASGLPRHDAPGQPFVASANNRPEHGDVAVGHFFSPNDRVHRLRHLLGGGGPRSLADLSRLHRDVAVPRAKAFAAHLVALLDQSGHNREQSALMAALAEWDGVYGSDSEGALAFELLAYRMILKLHGKEHLPVYAATWDAWALLAEDLEHGDAASLRAAAALAAREAEPVFLRLGNWGEAHRLHLDHFLARAPIIGKRYRFADLPSAGANETLMKTAHGFASGRHRVQYGANARHLSDLADPDANRFVLLGGQDGWLGSSTWMDQVPLWRAGEYVPMPLTPDAVAASFRHVTTLRPGAGR